ncbi:response regulator [Evansella sp. AB-rgal1]|uniref:response regulator transcription factor n=1 Tax=Evansella sp. AB-rgal1 TaxID=3242696 RepID=UPI00359DA516
MNLFLVEDEPWALMELVELFKRYEPAHTIYSFENGDDAFSALEKVHPQLVISDITMPGMNGLELINRILKVDPSVKCIILSVHDQFNYAQQSIKIGVIDYLLKPIKKEQLYTTVDQVIATIESEERKIRESEILAISKMLYTSLENEEEHILYRNSYYLVCLILENREGDKSWADSSITKGEWLGFLERKSLYKNGLFCLDYDSQSRVLLIPEMEKENQIQIEIHLKDIYEQMKSKEIVHMSYLKKRENESIARTFALVNKNLEKHMRFGQSTFVPPEALEEEVDLTNVWVKIRVIETLISKGELLKLNGVIDSITLELQHRKITISQLKLLINNMHYALKYKLKEKLESNTDIESIQINLDILNKLSDFNQLSNWLKEVFENLAEYFTPTLIEPKHLIPRVVQWIHNNYQDNLFFQDFANEHHVSLSYLSREFKAQTGCTFSEYIMRYRMEKAKEFFTEGINKTSEVCKLVGYEDPKHFSSVFKRVEGMTPKDYKKLIQSRKKIKTN